MDLPVDVLHWLFAFSPIALLLVLLAVLRWKAPEAGPVGLFLAVLVAVVLFEAGADVIAVAAGKGIWDAIFILFVVWPALLLYRVADAAGALEALRHGIAQFSRNDLFLVLAFGWVFASFLQGIAGFGAPIAVVAPLLIALGVKPLYAVVIPLIGHAWCNMFGTLAVGWLATIRVVEIEDPTLTAFQTALLLWIPNLLGALWIAWLYGRGAAVRHAAPMIVVISLIHGAGQALVTLGSPLLSAFIASTVALVAVYPLSRWRRYSDPLEDVDSPVMQAERGEEEPEPVMSLPMALVPYIVLTLVSIAVLVPPPVEDRAGAIEVGIPFPEVETGLGVTNEGEREFAPFSPLTHPGTFLLLAAAATYALYRTRDYYSAWRERSGDRPRILGSVVTDAVPASVAIVSFLVLSQVLEHSGQTDVLALGLEAVTVPIVYAFFASWIGVLGAFMTSSNTASNIIFADLQDTVAQESGLSSATVIAAQSTGGAIGNAIAPANVVLGTGTAGIVGQEGGVLRLTLPFAVAATVLVGLGTVALELVW